jgi:formamidopyrimidine-DNA glycosylase
MPELPEVETIKNELMPHVLGHKIVDVTLFWERMVQNKSVEEFRSRLIGQEITGLDRRGKYLLFELGSGEVMVIHLRMSGSLLLADRSDGKYTRAVFHLDNGTKLCFRDPRKFGVIWVAENKDFVDARLGPEPLGSEFTVEAMAGLLHNRTAPVKALLIDQLFIAGIGNMYADEALFAAGIHPLRAGGSLSQEEVKRLHHAIREVLESAIGNKGASIVSYYRPGGELGTAHYKFKVAHGRGKRCSNCGTPIERIKVRNRGTYFCPRCQPLSG